MNTPARLSIRQVTQLCGQPIGPLRRDPNFPPMQHGSFDEAAVMAWKTALDAKANNPEGQKNG